MIAATEETLIAQTLAGNTRAFDHLVERHRSWIQRRVLASTRQNEEAEDVVQEVFCRAFEQLSHLRQPEHFGPWLASIATRITTSHWRRQECWQRISTQMRYRETPGPTQPDELCEKRELEETLRRLLIEMPERYRRPLQLYYFERAS